MDYQTNDPQPQVAGQASLAHYTGQTLFITRKQLDGDYDENGTYFGRGEPLFWVHTEDGEIDYMLRALTLERARDKVLDKYPNAKIAGDQYNVSLDRDTLQQLLDMEVESMEGTEGAEIDDMIVQTAAEYEAAVLSALGKWVAEHLNQIDIEGNDFEPDADGLVTEAIVRELSDLRGGAGYLYFMEAEGAGVGTWDGGWDHIFLQRGTIKELSVHVGNATHAEYQKLKDALINAALVEESDEEE